MLLNNICYKRFFLCAMLAGAFILLKYYRITNYCSLEYVHHHIEFLQYFIQQHYLYSVFLYIGSFMLASAIALPGSVFFLMVAGLLFGAFPGMLYAAIGGTSGAAILFLLSRYIIGDLIQRKYAHQLAFLNRKIALYGPQYLFFIRLGALLPFFLVNVLSGITLMPFWRFISVTFLGIIPGALLFCYAGQTLIHVSSVHNFFEPPLFIAFCFLIIVKIVIVPCAYFHLKNHV